MTGAPSLSTVLCNPPGKASAERRTALTRNPYFDIGGNRYRLVVRFDYARRIGFVRFVGIHAEYDQIDASTV